MTCRRRLPSFARAQKPLQRACSFCEALKCALLALSRDDPALAKIIDATGERLSLRLERPDFRNGRAAMRDRDYVPLPHAAEQFAEACLCFIRRIGLRHQTSQ